MTGGVMGFIDNKSKQNSNKQKPPRREKHTGNKTWQGKTGHDT